MKKFILPFTLPCLIFLLSIQHLKAQKSDLMPKDKQEIVDKIAQLMQDHYVFPEVATQTGDHLKRQLAAGKYDGHSNYDSFSEALTKEAQSIANDRHLRIRLMPPKPLGENTLEQRVDDRLRALEKGRAHAGGFAAARILEGNIGYLDLRGFVAPQWGAPVVDRAMGLLQNTDALIIDLRKNGGGSPAMVQYLCSYFFDKKVHLNSIYRREGNQTEEFWSLEKVGGPKRSDVPLFVLTSSFTFSAAEEFTYNMQTQKRAMIIGETTGGGANPGGGFPINEKLMIFIPTGQAINPITKTNWEGKGIIPDVQVGEVNALEKAIEIATAAADTHRQKNKTKHKELLHNLYQQLDQPRVNQTKDAIVSCLKSCIDASLMNEGDINLLGYDYLMNQNKPIVAEIIFYANTILFPESANVYDSYGEVLTANDKLDEAIQVQRKAVQLGKVSNDPNLPIFMDNLAKMEQRVLKKP